MDNVFSDIVFDRDLKWGIQNGWLSNIECLRTNIGFDLSSVAKRLGDYAAGELDDAMNIESQNKAIAEAYHTYAKGQTVIFATSVAHAESIAEEIPGAVAVTATTPNRQQIIKDFTERKIPVLVNCMIFTEGTDIPLTLQQLRFPQFWNQHLDTDLLPDHKSGCLVDTSRFPHRSSNPCIGWG